VIEVMDGDKQIISTLSKAVCNGQVTWTQSHIIPLTPEEDEKNNAGTTKKTERQSLYFQTADVAVTGLYKCEKYLACN
jgi:hypothetical protein